MLTLSTSSGQHERLAQACAELEPPFACVDLDAYEQNRATLTRRAGGKTIRLASKSLRCRALIERLLAGEDAGFHGVLALTVDEALWLTEHRIRDVVVGYPSVNRAALSAVASRGSSGTPDEGTNITLM